MGWLALSVVIVMAGSLIAWYLAVVAAPPWPDAMAEAREQAKTAHPSGRPRPKTARLVFASVRRGVVELDCITAEDPGCGTPFALVASIPAGDPWAVDAESLLAQWAEEGTAVEVEVVGDPAGPELRLADGRRMLRLSLASA